MAFYESLRLALGRCAGGVHRAAAGSKERGPALARASLRIGTEIPPAYADFLLSFDGVALFHEQVVLFGADDPGLAAVSAGQVRIGETPEGALWMSRDGAIRLVDEELLDPVLCGSQLERYLDALLAREALLIDRDGEFRDVCDENGQLREAVRRRRVQIGRRLDPQAALYLLEEGELLVERRESAGALSALTQAVTLDPGAGPAWELLGALHRVRGDLAAAEDAALRAAAATGNAWLRASRLLDAARVAPVERRSRHARAAWAADPEHAARLLAEARGRLSAEGPAAAHELGFRIELLMDVAPEGHVLIGEARSLLRTLRTREALRVV